MYITIKFTSCQLFSFLSILNIVIISNIYLIIYFTYHHKFFQIDMFSACNSLYLDPDTTIPVYLYTRYKCELLITGVFNLRYFHILDDNLKLCAHVYREIGNLICSRRLFTSTSVGSLICVF